MVFQIYNFLRDCIVKNEAKKSRTYKSLVNLYNAPIYNPCTISWCIYDDFKK